MSSVRQNKIVTITNDESYDLAGHQARMADATNVPILVSSQAERDALTKYIGITVRRLDVANGPLEAWDGTAWRRGPGMNIGQGSADPYTAMGNAVVTTNASGDATITLPTPFASALVSFLLMDTTDPASLGAIVLKGTLSTSTKTSLTFRAYQTSGSVLASQLISVAWVAAGY